MRSGARCLGSLLLGCSLLAVACQLPALRPPPAPAPPERALTICERPARQPAAAQDPKVEASFSAFARTWLEKMRKAGAAKLAPGGRRQIRAEFETELRPYPHPRSARALEAHARFFGASVGCEAAEPFVLVRGLQRLV